MKLFSQLSPQEVNEQVALRLGYRQIGSYYKCGYENPHWHNETGECVFQLPDWLHDDGLAFVDLWPKIT